MLVVITVKQQDIAFIYCQKHHWETEGIMGEKGRKNVKKPKQNKVKKQEEVKEKK